MCEIGTSMCHSGNHWLQSTCSTRAISLHIEIYNSNDTNSWAKNMIQFTREQICIRQMLFKNIEFKLLNMNCLSSTIDLMFVILFLFFFWHRCLQLIVFFAIWPHKKNNNISNKVWTHRYIMPIHRIHIIIRKVIILFLHYSFSQRKTVLRSIFAINLLLVWIITLMTMTVSRKKTILNFFIFDW